MKAKAPPRFAPAATEATRGKALSLLTGDAGPLARPRPFLVQALRLRPRKPAR